MIIWTAFGALIGATLTWLLARSSKRQALAEAAAESLEAATQLQIELSLSKEQVSRLSELETRLAYRMDGLNAASQRTATLESEVQRLPALERIRAQGQEELDAALRATGSLKEHVSRLAAELTADRDVLGSIRLDEQEG